MKTNKYESKISRRGFLVGITSAVAFVSMLKLGIKFAKDTVKDIKNVILPPGAIDKKIFLNKCLNCNLCVKSCPKGIIRKANENFGTIHIEYERNVYHATHKGYCRFNCNVCSKVCPTGIIKKISIDTKHHTKIASATIHPDKCRACKDCMLVCPVKAIFYDENKNSCVVNDSKCVGCGKCKAICAFSAPDIIEIDEQKII